MSNSDPSERLAQDERRGQTRQAKADFVRIKITTAELSGQVENLSDGGLFVVLDESVQLEIEFSGEVGVDPRPAHLIRCHALPGGKSGWGIQFELDREDG